MTKRCRIMPGVPESSDSCSSSSSSSASDATTSGSVCFSKRPRALQCYRNDYQQMAEFKQWVVPSSKGKFYARCKLCCSDLNISQGGRSILKFHVKLRLNSESICKISGNICINAEGISHMAEALWASPH